MPIVFRPPCPGDFYLYVRVSSRIAPKTFKTLSDGVAVSGKPSFVAPPSFPDPLYGKLFHAGHYGQKPFTSKRLEEVAVIGTKLTHPEQSS